MINRELVAQSGNSRFNDRVGERGMGLLRLLRRFPRVRLETGVAMAHAGRPLLGSAVDISEGGLGMRMRNAPPEDGTMVQMSFYLPGRAEPIETVGRITHPTVF